MADNPLYPVSLTYYSSGPLSTSTYTWDFDAASMDDAFEKAIVEHEYPFRDGAEIEDMGQIARTIRIRAFFIGDNYESHKDLINQLATQPGAWWEMDHPAYGLVKGQVKAFFPRHDPREETAEVDITFVEELRGSIEPVYKPAVDQAVQDQFVTGQDELAAHVDADIVTYGPTYTRTLGGYAAIFQDQLPGVANPSNGLVEMCTYTDDPTGRMVQALAQCVERYAVSFQNLSANPSGFMATFAAAINSLSAFLGSGAPGSGYVLVAGAQQGAVQLSQMLASDADTAASLDQAVSQPAFSAEGKLLRDPASPDLPLSVAEIENALAAANTLIEAAVNACRDVPSLKDMAGALLDHVTTVKKNAPKALVISVPNPMPLQLICLQQGLPYGYAEALLLANNIRRPNYTQGQVNVYVP